MTTLYKASMRPRLIAVDDRSISAGLARIERASMRPRLIAVDDLAIESSFFILIQSFNEATAYCRG